MKIHFTICFLLCFQVFCAQQTPKLTLDNKEVLQLTRLHVNTQINGNYAVTEYEMTFYNGRNRIMEGELEFPLAQGQSVSGMAMDINGSMRPAVVVEKEKARTAYESTIRQKIDPALLEKTQGNNYKMRVYPIPAKGFKTVVLTYEEVLPQQGSNIPYIIPLGITETLDDLSIQLTITGASKAPTIVGTHYGGNKFKKKGTQYIYTYRSRQTQAKASFKIHFQLPENKERIVRSGALFYAYPELRPNHVPKKLPKKITLIWDASLSQLGRDWNTETALLDQYLSSVYNSEVQCIVLSNSVRENKTFTINNTADLQALYSLIKSTPYDGGTSWRELQHLSITGDEVLFFTDGMVNLGSFPFDPQVPWYFINSNTRSNHELLQQNAEQSGGKYLNLQRSTLGKALQELKTESYTFLGMVHTEKSTEVYPKPGTPVTPNFSIAGNVFVEEEISLVFGYGTKPLDTISFVLPSENTNELVVRRWAQLKVAELNKNKKAHKKEIIALATQHHLVTDYTSLIILDRLRDYLRFNIEPPQELLADYKAQKRRQKEQVAARRRGLESKKEGLMRSYERILNWHQRDFSKPKDAIKTVTNTTNITRTASFTPGDKTVTGIVTDENNLPLPGTNVIIKGTTIGAQTNFDGIYTLPAGPGAILEFSYLGYHKLTREVPANGALSIAMEPDHKSLQEVVVVGYGRPKVAKAVGYAVTTLNAEEIENKPEEDVVRSLNGKVAGVNIVGNSGATGSGTNFVIRSQSSINGNNQPLYIVDGVPFDGNPKEKGFASGNTVTSSRFLDLGPENIESVEILKGLSSSVLYGQQGRNGVVIITTKKGRQENPNKIASFETKVEQAVNLQGWDANMPYLPLLAKQSSVEMSYETYLNIRHKYFNQPTFYIDVAQFFYDQGANQLALRILTNILELKINDQELLKALAYQLEVFKAYDLATLVYQNLVNSYPEHPQNYRDLALMYEATGKYQESFDLLHSLYKGDLLEKDVDNRFNGIEQLAFVELCRLVHKNGKKLNLTKKERAAYPKLDMDIRVVLDWNHDNTDLDLWVKEPTTEKIFYSNKDSDIGGMLSKDMTRGFGPECYMLKKAMDGTYEILVDYYNDQQQKISGPTLLKTTVYKNYGTEKESREVFVKRLVEDDDEILVQSLIW